jgi:hypothetical protein
MLSDGGLGSSPDGVNSGPRTRISGAVVKSMRTGGVGKSKRKVARSPRLQPPPNEALRSLQIPVAAWRDPMETCAKRTEGVFVMV